MQARENSSPEISRPVEARGGRKGKGREGADVWGWRGRERKEGERGRVSARGSGGLRARERKGREGRALGLGRGEKGEERSEGGPPKKKKAGPRGKGEPGRAARKTRGKATRVRKERERDLGCWAGCFSSSLFYFFFLIFQT
jgi:hypothetical protein